MKLSGMFPEFNGNMPPSDSWQIQLSGLTHTHTCAYKLLVVHAATPVFLSHPLKAKAVNNVQILTRSQCHMFSSGVFVLCPDIYAGSHICFTSKKCSLELVHCNNRTKKTILTHVYIVTATARQPDGILSRTGRADDLLL